MLKHLYCAPTIKVATVETEGIMTIWSGAETTKKEQFVESVGSGVKQDYSNDPDSKSGEDEGAKGISFDFE